MTRRVGRLIGGLMALAGLVGMLSSLASWFTRPAAPPAASQPTSSR